MSGAVLGEDHGYVLRGTTVTLCIQGNYLRPTMSSGATALSTVCYMVSYTARYVVSKSQRPQHNLNTQSVMGLCARGSLKTQHMYLCCCILTQMLRDNAVG